MQKNILPKRAVYVSCKTKDSLPPLQKKQSTSPAKKGSLPQEEDTKVSEEEDAEEETERRKIHE